MRRIPFLLGLLGQYWKNHPDLRFFQIISMIHQNIPAKIEDEFYLEDDELMSILQKLCQSVDMETTSDMHTLYSDAEALAYHSGIKTDGNTEYVDVYVDDAEYFDEKTGRDESVSFTFRLPQRKIVKIDKQTSPFFVHSDWEKEGIREIVWRILEDEEICLYCDENNTAYFTALRFDENGQSFTDVEIDNICYRSRQGQSWIVNDLIQERTWCHGNTRRFGEGVRGHGTMVWRGCRTESRHTGIHPRDGILCGGRHAIRPRYRIR